MNHLIRCLIVLVAAGAVLATGLPEAESARSASLGESRLITDQNDVYTFPQLGVEHTQLFNLNFGPVDEFGSGLVLLGDEDFSYGFGAYQGDLLDPRFGFPHPRRDIQRMENVSDPFNQPGFGPDEPLGAHTMVDFFGSADIGAGQVGGRLSFGTAGAHTEDIDNLVTGARQNFGALTLGFSLTGDFRLDTSLTTQVHSASAVNEPAGQDDPQRWNQATGHSFVIGNSTRGFVDMDDGVELGFLADFTFRNTDWTDWPDDADARLDQRSNHFALSGGAGPAYTIEDTTLATYFLAGMTRDSADLARNEPDLLEYERTSRVTLPGVHVAADIEVLDWLFFRSGLQYSYVLVRDGEHVEVGDDTGDTDVSTRTSDFGWRTGIGIETGQFSFDGVFQQGFVTAGPDFLGGEGGGMFTMVSATYEF